MSDAAVAEVVVSDAVKKVHDSASALSTEDKGQLFVEMLKTMTGLELVEASKMIEDQLDVTASGGGAVMMVGGGGDAGAAAEPEQTAFDVHLTSYGDKKIQVIKAVRGLTGKGLKEAKEIVDGVPTLLAEGLEKDEADKYKSELEGAGASVEIK